MKNLLSILLCLMLCLMSQMALAAGYPDGSIMIYNASANNVTAKISSFGKFTLGANERRDISYSTLSSACSYRPTNCRADFYVNNRHAGSATLNVMTGKVVNMNLAMKVRMGKGASHILRSVIIK